jgi:asparagine synthase (glutamine-hydrolysing)
MCGIAGYTGKNIPGLTVRMLDSIGHRGPDDRGEYTSAQVHFGMVRLSIIDLKGGHQPIINEDDTISVVFNGEIYNYVELRDELEKQGHRFRTASDTETIVHAYEEYGLSFPHKLNGMFSIAIWDGRQQRLVLVRDRFGVKPLFYAHLGDDVVFGSEIKALLCFPGISKELDPEGLSHFFSLRHIPAPFTIYKSIRALLPGTMMVWGLNDLKISKWYELRMQNLWVEEDEDELVETLDSILRDSVRLRLRSDVDFGAYLSGGIDSSTVVAIMSGYAAKPVKTFSLAYADRPANKSDAFYARKIAERYGTEHHEYVMNMAELRDDIRGIIRHLDQPFAGVVASYWLSRFMRDHVKVALSGDGADDLFGSYGHHRLVWPIAAYRRDGDQGKVAGSHDMRPYQDHAESVNHLARFQPWEWRLAYAAFMEHEKRELFSEQAFEMFANHSTSDYLKQIYERTSSDTDDLNRMLYLDINVLLPNEVLYYNDMLSMAHALEVRTPFLDFRLAELACSIPGTLKIRNGTLKYIFRRVASRYLPNEILNRPKEGFVLPKNIWLRKGLASMVTETLSAIRLSRHGYFNQSYVQSLITSFLAGDDRLTFKIWTLIVFQLWYEEHTENPTW